MLISYTKANDVCCLVQYIHNLIRQPQSCPFLGREGGGGCFTHWYHSLTSLHKTIHPPKIHSGRELLPRQHHHRRDYHEQLVDICRRLGVIYTNFVQLDIPFSTCPSLVPRPLPFLPSIYVHNNRWHGSRKNSFNFSPIFRFCVLLWTQRKIKMGEAWD